MTQSTFSLHPFLKEKNESLIQKMVRFFPEIIIAFLVFSSVKADEQNICDQSCENNKIPIPYPFGFSENCGIRLNCSGGDVLVENIYKVKNISSEKILIDFPSKCNRKVKEIEVLSGVKGYTMTWRNSLVLTNCTEQQQQSMLSIGCMLPKRMVESGLGSIGCVENDEINCYSKEGIGSDFIDYEGLSRTGCRAVVSSFTIDLSGVAGRIAFGELELEWWLVGKDKINNKCSLDALSVTVNVPNGGEGFRCSCKEGFEGDGFANGKGCRKVSSSSVPKCSASRYMFGHCGGRSKFGVLFVGLASGAILMAVLVLLCYFIRLKSNSSNNQITTRRILSEATGRTDVPFFSYKEIERATNGFSENQRLGIGAYGTVYSGKLHNDELVAIKRIRHRDADSVEQVMNEIKLLSSVSHPNLVRLLGCCIEKNEQILVYEYMPNGTLSQHLQRERGSVLPWTVRLSIATETAHAIAYLHSSMNPPIYHRDIKSSNILLDYNFSSKVADFGLSRLGLTDDSHISTAPQGTPGYVDPQYHQNYHLSDKSDVYSFGVVLVEIITALKVVDFTRPNSEVNLAALALERIGNGQVDEIIDHFLEPNRDAWTLSSIHKVFELAFRCLAFHRDMRPSMKEVADELEQVRLSGWAPLEENVCMTSSVASTCSSPLNASERSTGGVSLKKAMMGSRRSVLSQRVADSLNSKQEVKDCSPVSVQEYWPSEQSSPSTNSLLGRIVR